jgi:hypothetical protein
MTHIAGVCVCVLSAAASSPFTHYAQRREPEAHERYVELGYPMFGSVSLPIPDSSSNGHVVVCAADPGFASTHHPGVAWLLDLTTGTVLWRHPLYESGAKSVFMAAGRPGSSGLSDKALVAVVDEGPEGNAYVLALPLDGRSSVTTLRSPLAERHILGPLGVCNDVDEDGLDELWLLVSSPTGDGPNVAVFSGLSERLLFERPVSSSGDHGDTNWCVRDLDHDGTEELVIGHPPAMGAVAVLSIVSLSPNGTSVARMGRATDAELGTSVAVHPDMNGDGVLDIVLGTRGTIAVVSGKDASTLIEFRREQERSFGKSVGIIGDLTGDGRPDVLVSRPETDVMQGAIDAVDIWKQALVYSIDGPVSDGRFGDRIVSMGDLDADGCNDFLVCGRHDIAHYPGSLYVLSGRNGKQLTRLSRAAGEIVFDGIINAR